MTETYMRIVPRDLFNEANLLKCIGTLVLLIEDRKINWLTYEHDGSPFEITQDESSGAIMISNITFAAKGKLLNFQRPLNSRDPWPLYLETENESFPVFDDKGNFILTRKQIA